MMASIFFTERLPGISKFKLLRSRQPAHHAQVVGSIVPDPATRRDPATAVFQAIKHDEPKRLPRKQALCQVKNRSDYRNVIRPLMAFRLLLGHRGRIAKPTE